MSLLLEPNSHRLPSTELDGHLGPFSFRSENILHKETANPKKWNNAECMKCKQDFLLASYLLSVKLAVWSNSTSLPFNSPQISFSPLRSHKLKSCPETSQSGINGTHSEEGRAEAVAWEFTTSVIGSAGKLRSRQVGFSIPQERTADRERKDYCNAIASTELGVGIFQSGPFLILLSNSSQLLVVIVELWKLNNQVPALVLCSQ